MLLLCDVMCFWCGFVVVVDVVCDVMCVMMCEVVCEDVWMCECVGNVL